MSATQTESWADLERRVAGAWQLRRPVGEIEHGEGAWLVTREGERLLDLTSGYGTCPLGHAHPRLVAALQRQAGTLWSAPSFLLAEVRGRYLAALAEVLPKPLEHLFLTNSGAEAVEAGLKFARLATGRTGVVAVRGSFHGRTLGALAATSNPKARKPEAVLESSGVRFVRRDDSEGLAAAIDESCAVVLLEVIQGEGGVRASSASFLADAQRLARAHDALLMIDEIQTGFGRTGTLFACEGAGLEPDLMAMAKGAGGGFPLGALAYSKAIESALSPGAHGSTFGGNALACAAGLALLEAFTDEAIVEQAAETGEWLRGELESRLRTVPIVREIRGRGMMLAIELRQRAGRYIAALAAEQSVLVLPAGPNVIRLLPPLNASRDELRFGLEAISRVLA